jgi:pimeloyl-ACP methyl ester carboxylesterase
MADTYRIDDIDLYAVVRGSGRPLVLLHGFPLDHTMCPQLARQGLFSAGAPVRALRCTAPDSRS